ncbi:Hypothetical predicted protein [Cloeon dipterum]|uniref:Uncharacterized protein n=1 Tax=Cloeon dipterum TaxID=197152 RepID=A0A8S1D6F3_9INSE|nr:Hypothetical predicted protein [Cloeon dipterum]
MHKRPSTSENTPGQFCRCPPPKLEEINSLVIRIGGNVSSQQHASFGRPSEQDLTGLAAKFRAYCKVAEAFERDLTGGTPHSPGEE